MRIWLPAVCLLAALIGVMSVALARSQNQSRTAIEQRYALRATLASRFVGAYIADVGAQEKEYAKRFLTARSVEPARFDLAVQAFGFDAAVLVDAQGRALDIVPRQRELIGTRVVASYPHLRSALGGRPTVSDVVLSEARALPIVAVAVPFETPFGRRVFSGGAQLDRSPLAAFLADTLPYRGARAYLIDSKGFVMVAGGSSAAVLAAPPDTSGATGSIAVAGTQYRFASAPIPGTPWRLLTVTPSHALFVTLSGWQHWVPWVALTAFALVAAVALLLLSRLLHQRRQLADLATRDPLTGALNRRTLERVFHRMSAAAARSEAAVGVLAIDLDRFKSVNDSYGHAAGDELLRGVAETLRLTVRPSDVVARIGGDEFVVLLSAVSEPQAREIARRVHETFATSRFRIAEDAEIGARCSVGVAMAGEDDVIDAVLARADHALYRSKDAGRGLGTAAAAL